MNHEDVVMVGVRRILQHHYDESPTDAIKAIAVVAHDLDRSPMEGLSDDEARIASVYALACDDTMRWVSSILAEAGLMGTLIDELSKIVTAENN